MNKKQMLAVATLAINVLSVIAVGILSNKQQEELVKERVDEIMMQSEETDAS